MQQQPSTPPSDRYHSHFPRIRRHDCRVVAAALCWMIPSAALANSVDFRRDVLPMLSENCFTCHGPDSKTRKADLRLDVKEGALRTKDPVIVPGKSSESELVERITSTDPDEVMPPPKSGKKLTGSQIDSSRNGSTRERAGRGTGRSSRSAGRARRRCANARWVKNPIDRFVLAGLEAEGLRRLPRPTARPCCAG